MTAPGELASIAVRRTALEQVRRLMAALDRELARVERSQPVDTTAALRLAKIFRQLVPALGELEAQERATLASREQEPAKAQGLAARIAAQSTRGPSRTPWIPTATAFLRPDPTRTPTEKDGRRCSNP
jgi:hypothetical protein